MIKISENIQLKEILNSDAEFLFTLMKEIYTPAYQHFWIDEGAWYLNSQYSKENILKELLDKKSRYYFILFKGEIVGNFRFIWDDNLKGLPEEKQVKLHRVYLHPKTQRNGIGKLLLAWLEEKAKQKNYQIIWLDAMNEQQNAFKFYKKLGYSYFSHTFLPFDLMHERVRKMSQVYKQLI
jgi:ribosomal protein S18 acetylase RimI-like enzyme